MDCLEAAKAWAVVRGRGVDDQLTRHVAGVQTLLSVFPNGG